MRKLVATIVTLAGVLGTAGALAQGTPPQGGTVSMQGSMCGGPGGMCGMIPPTQATPMQGTAQGQPGNTAMGCCPMMQRAAAVDSRLRQLEERAGIPSPPAQPAAPHTGH